ncbi:hypothetical protein EYD45_00260 [Hyunsoonleella flava]|uniref:Carboxypeptidase-like regulatory domain-containing protein n=1 Tax=Hyunsoonleella flava TaxID=2527939 RepID=A0A4Q9FJC3_9FLAO|nr:carboxypeptidase-like regulatory domain-containing protein [Hyunsoonleella flava]TBN06354.1 hypothetical protein EYD45_00260 [Hyunsoonleella flava]
MKANFSISIQNPCSERFSGFEKTASGGFCKSCEKEVIDFRNMTDMQVKQVLKQKADNTCGYFRKGQLHKKSTAMETRRRSMLKFIKAAAIAVLAFNTFQNVEAQDKNSVTETVQNLKSDKAQDKLLKGVVKDESGPLAGASILLKGTKIGVTADFDGKFVFPKALNEGDILLISYIGYETQKFIIEKDQKFLNVQLTGDDIDLLGEVQVNQVYISNRKAK